MTIVTATDSSQVSTGYELRLRIDEIDSEIGRLFKERRNQSFQIQRERVRSGGARVDLSRENEIIQGYVTRLGPDGKEIANTVLTFCRGDINASDNERES